MTDTMVSEINATQVASSDDSDDEPHRSRHSGGGGEPGALFGHMMMGGLFGRR